MKALSVLNKSEILNFLNNNQQYLNTLGVKQIALFGSYVRQEQHVSSDIDFLVEFQKGQKTYDNFISLIDFLEDSFEREVEVVTKESLSKNLIHIIEEEAVYVKILD